MAYSFIFVNNSITVHINSSIFPVKSQTVLIKIFVFIYLKEYRFDVTYMTWEKRKMIAYEKTGKMVLGALLICMIVVLTMFMKIPIPMTQGYVHLGDAIIFLSVLILGWKYGAVVAGTGSAMADLLCGMVIWAPWTFVIKFVMAALMGLILERSKHTVSRGREVAAMIVSGIWMAFGYFIAEGTVYGNWAIALLGVPWNIGQFAVGAILAGTLSLMLCRTSAKKFFRYRLNTR